MTYLEKYQTLQKWHEKIIVIELYHLACKQKNNKWRVRDTANYFHISMGLCSENLRIAQRIHDNPKLLLLGSREEVLRLIYP